MSVNSDNDDGHAQLSHVFTPRERIKNCTSQLLYSREFQAYYLIMIILNVFALGFTLVHPTNARDQPWLLTLEAFLTMAIVVEVFLRFSAQGLRNFLNSKWNIFDCFIAILVLLSFILFVSSPTEAEEIEDLIQFVFRIARDIFMLVHFVSSQRHARLLREDIVDLEFADDDGSIQESEDGATLSLLTGNKSEGLDEVMNRLLGNTAPPVVQGGVMQSLQRYLSPRKASDGGSNEDEEEGPAQNGSWRRKSGNLPREEGSDDECVWGGMAELDGVGEQGLVDADEDEELGDCSRGLLVDR